MTKTLNVAPTDVVLDLRGYRCPMPVVRAEAALRRLPQGARLVLIADDPIASVDLPHYARTAGHGVRRLADQGSACVFLVTRGENIMAFPDPGLPEDGP